MTSVLSRLMVVVGVGLVASCSTTLSTEERTPTDQPAASESRAEPSQEIAFGEHFELGFGASKTIFIPAAQKHLEMHFEGIVEDSRCPTDVTCVWAGNAEISIRVTVDGSELPVSLNSNRGSRFQQEAHILDLVLRLEGLEPTPHSSRSIESRDYVADLSVRSGVAENSDSS